MRYLKLAFIVCLLVGVACATGPKAEQSTQQEQSAVAPVRITFEVAGRKYEAVSFLRAGESSVTGDEMIARTNAENGGGLGQEDGEFLWEHRFEFPKEFASYFLVLTRWRDPSHSRCIRFFDWNGDKWYQDWVYLDNQWDRYDLVVRRLP